MSIDRLSGRVTHAALWANPSAQWLSLHPVGAVSRSFVRCMSGSAQGGSADIGDQYMDHAGIWDGSAGSWIDLQPPETSASSVLGMNAGVQVGEIMGRAYLWRSTVESRVRLNPPGTEQSYAYGVDGDYQVGMARINGEYHASLWRGTAASWLDLHSFLQGFEASEARGVWFDGATIYVVGSGQRIGGTTEALLWTLRVCDADCNADGTLTLADFGCFQTAFATGAAYADCNHDGAFDLADFGCFQTGFALGCP